MTKSWAGGHQTPYVTSGLLLLVGLAASLLAGCSLSDDFDGYTFGPDAARDAGDTQTEAGPAEGGADAGGDAGAECRLATDCGPGMRCIRGDCVMAPPPPQDVYQTNGGGSLESGGYRIRVTVGAPQPMTTMRSGSYELKLGPPIAQP